MTCPCVHGVPVEKWETSRVVEGEDYRGSSSHGMKKEEEEESVFKVSSQ